MARMCLTGDPVSTRPQLLGSDIDTPLTLPGSPPSAQLPLLLLGVMEGGRMRREEVSFLQADCWMKRLRDGQMTMAGRPGPECRPRETCTRLHVGSSHHAKCTERRPARRIWQGDPFTHPPSISCQPLPFSLLPDSALSPLPPFTDAQPGGDELTRRVKTSLGALSFFLDVIRWRGFFLLFFLGNSVN